jgi:hypothetical protein
MYTTISIIEMMTIKLQNVNLGQQKNAMELQNHSSRAPLSSSIVMSYHG